MAIESTVNVNGKRSASDADLQVADGNTSKCVQAEQQHVDPFIQLRQKSVYGRYLDTVEFLVGPDAEPFLLHTGVLIHRCPAFAQAVLPENVVNLHTTPCDLGIRLPYQEPRCFRSFSVWLYTRRLMRPPSGGDRRDGSMQGVTPEPRLVPGIDDKSDDTWEDVDLIKLFLFGKRYGIHKLANAAISALAAQNMRLRRSSSASAVEVASHAVTGRTMLWNYLIEEAALQLKQWQVKLDDRNDSFPADFISSVRLELDKHKALGFCHTETIKKPCRYHTHEGLVEQPRCQQRQHAAMDPSERFNSDYYNHLQDIGKVLVGPSEMAFRVHKGLMSARSEYFRGAFEGHFAEGESGIVRLEEEDPVVFRILLHAIYDFLRRPDATDRKCFEELRQAINTDIRIPARDGNGEVIAIALGNEHDQGRRTDIDELWRDDLIDLYILCDRRGIPSIRHRIMDELVKYKTTTSSLSVGSSLERICNIWNNLPPKAGLCKFLVDEAAREWHSRVNFISDIGQLPPDFLGKVIQKTLDLREDDFYVPTSAWSSRGAEIYYNDYKP